KAPGVDSIYGSIYIPTLTYGHELWVTERMEIQILDKETLCKIPPNVNNWTIHGLWPVKAHNCCSCWPMFHSDIKDLETNLTEFWPSFLKSRSDFQFW
uniref:Uncharacterized protein n=1 Tax=Periophthalmus magnuspinnatus TaxID=409849 RepID=A0A3B3ZDR4_9GOBI